MKNYLSKIVFASILLLLVMVFVLPSQAGATMSWSQPTVFSPASTTMYRIKIDDTGVYIAGEISTGGGASWQRKVRIEKRALDTGNLVSTFGTNGALISEVNGIDYAKDIALDSSYLYIIGEHLSITPPSPWLLEKRDKTTGALISSKADFSNQVVHPTSISVDATGIYISGKTTQDSLVRGDFMKISLDGNTVLWNQVIPNDNYFPLAVASYGGVLYTQLYSSVDGESRYETRNSSTGVLISSSTTYTGPVATTIGLQVFMPENAWGNNHLAVDSSGSRYTMSNESEVWNATKTAMPTVTISASPTTVSSGSSSTISWTVANATSCSTFGSWNGNKDATNGTHTESTGALTSQGTYYITCRDGLGFSSPTTSVTVNVSVPYTVTGTAGANGTVSPSTRTVSSGGTTTFTVTPNSGYVATATGCGGSLSGTTYTTGAINSSCTVSASFNVAPSYTVTRTAGANGTVSPSSRTVSSGGTTTFTVTPSTGYRASVTGCNGSLSGTTYTTGAITSNCTVSASFISNSSSCTASDLGGWAWSSNIGWISFNSSDPQAGGGSSYKVSIDASKYLSGYAWSPNIGWIQFGGLSNFPVGSNTYSQNAQIVGTQLRGWAKALSADGNNGWDGWISLTGNSYGVVQASSSLHGYAWGSNILGWIDFSQVTTGCTAAFPVLSVGNINVSNYVITMLQKNPKMAWYTKLLQDSVLAVKDTFTSTAYADGAVSGKPIRLSTRITNLGVATNATFTNKYFIDKPNALGELDSNLKPGDLTGWDLVITPATVAGLGANAYVDSIGDITTGLPQGPNGIVFCADVNGTVSDPTQPLVSRCTAKSISNIGPAQTGGITFFADGSAGRIEGSSVSSVPSVLNVQLNSPVVGLSWTIDSSSVTGCSAVGPAWSSGAISTIASNTSGTDSVTFSSTGDRNFEIICSNALDLLSGNITSSITVKVSNSTGGICPASGVDSHKLSCPSGTKSAVTSSPSKWTWTCGGVACSESKSPIFVEP